jgi:hypothetical protein
MTKRCCLSSRLKDVTSHSTVISIFTSVRIANVLFIFIIFIIYYIIYITLYIYLINHALFVVPR